MYLTIDIGGTKTFIALFDDSGNIVESLKFPTDRDEKTFLNKLFIHLEQMRIPENPRNIVVAIPGLVENNSPKWFGNLPWQNPPIAETLKKLYTSPAYFKNDADLATLYESQFYSGKLIYLTFSTGIGGGLAENGRLETTSAKFEPGHKIYTFDGQPLEWEDIASAKALISALNVEKVTSVIFPRKLNEIARRVSIGLAPLIREYRPETIVFGGPLGLILPRFRFRLYYRLKQSLSENIPLPRLRKAKNPTRSVSYGAYLYGRKKVAKEQESLGA